MRIHRHRHSKPKFQIPAFKINRQIQVPEVRLIDAAGEMRGNVSTEEALKIAEDAGLDLIEVSPKANPPVCKVMDFGSFKYQKEKEAKKQRAASKEVEIKGIRLSFKIGVNDLEVRKKQALKFLEKGNKLRIELILRGREKAHFDRAREVMNGFVDSLRDDYDLKIESPVKKAGGRLHMIVAREK
ncbi:MAG: translation initiation factor IF-3 [Candidatus Uhrbacteria bacterium]|nr:translation initiation factor IF-3 [Candidatus Uhrbacteria bacterium]